jgi:putative nucleotidyltransferase with HDIG domain
MKFSDVEQVLGSLDKLPTLPVIYTKLLRLLQSPDTTIHAISNIIAEDQVIAAKVLQFVNSAFYGFPQRIGSLQRAIVILGFNAIKNLVLTTSVWDLFQKIQAGHQFNKESFWKHSIGCAVASRVLAEAADLKNPEDVFTGGLLHDIGKIVQAGYFPDQFNRVIDLIDQTGLPMVEAEKKVFGFDHAQIGTAIATRWRFPQETVNMIALHHLSNGTTGLNKTIAAVHIGNILATALRLGYSGEKLVPLVHDRAWETLGLGIGSLELVMEKVIKLYNENISILESS